MKLDHHIPPYTKINSKWIKDLNVRCEAIKLPEGNIGTKFPESWNDFLVLTSKQKQQKKKNLKQKWDYTKLKSFCTAKETINKMEKAI